MIGLLLTLILAHVFGLLCISDARVSSDSGCECMAPVFGLLTHVLGLLTHAFGLRVCLPPVFGLLTHVFGLLTHVFGLWVFAARV